MNKWNFATGDSLMVKVYEKKHGKAEKILIKLWGEKILLIGNKKYGSIATKEQYENFEEAMAHLTDGIIHQYGIAIGTIKDIEFLKD